MSNNPATQTAATPDLPDIIDLTLLLPNQVLQSAQVVKVGGDAVNGSFVVLPRHIDFATALVPGILYFEDVEADLTYIAIDSGILVKRGKTVWISVLQAIEGDNLDTLDRVVEEQFRQLDERQKQTQTALAHLEISFMRGMANLGRAYHES
jgi:F-type H+-transporting ATPase subunit epsilon